MPTFILNTRSTMFMQKTPSNVPHLWSSLSLVLLYYYLCLSIMSRESKKVNIIFSHWNAEKRYCPDSLAILCNEKTVEHITVLVLKVVMQCSSIFSTILLQKDYLKSHANLKRFIVISTFCNLQGMKNYTMAHTLDAQSP